MGRRVRTVVVVGLALAVLVTVAVAGVWWWRDRGGTAFEQAVGYAPADAERLSWTDWAAVRERAGADLDPDSSAQDVRDLLDEAFDDDLTSTSALVQSAPVLQTRFGFSPASIEWELFSQSARGALVIVRLPDDMDPDSIADRLRENGYRAPAGESGVWSGGEALLPGIGAELTPELQYVALDADERLVLTSDRPDYLQQVVDGLGDQEPDGALRDVVAASGEPLSASAYAGDRACRDLAMAQADSRDRATAERLVAEAGDVDPMTAFAMSVQPGGGVRVVLGFADQERAEVNADSRARLAAGPAPGQGGDFPDRFSVRSVTAEGDLVRLELDPREGAYVLSDLAHGPVLFATC